MNPVTNIVDAAGPTISAYTIAGRLFTEDGPWASDTVTNYYDNGLRTHFVLAQLTGSWTNVFGCDTAKRLTTVTSPAGRIIRWLMRQSVTLKVRWCQSLRLRAMSRPGCWQTATFRLCFQLCSGRFTGSRINASGSKLPMVTSWIWIGPQSARAGWR